MAKKIPVCWLFLSSAFACIVPLQAVEREPPRIFQLDGRFNYGKGVGYDQSYGTLQAFVSSSRGINGRVFPFLDARGHFFEGGKQYAANVGVGVRGIYSCYLVGLNASYDYRLTKHQHYNQVGGGVEIAGKVWGGSLNGYFPVGPKKSAFFDPSNVQFLFNGFSGNGFSTISSLLAKREFAFKGFNAECSAILKRTKLWDVSVAGGPYGFFGEYGQRAWGGQAKLQGTFRRLLSFFVNGSYDSLFGPRVNGGAMLSLSFGPRAEKGKCSSRVQERLYEPLHRQEIIVLNEKKMQDREAVTLINPLTGQPYFVIFVDNDPVVGNGTYEAPFATLIAAQNASKPGDLVYVFQGDGTTTGQDAGFIFQNNQMLLGSGVSQTLAAVQGTVVIPAQTPGNPVVTNLGGDVITLNGGNNVVSGFEFDVRLAASNAVTGASISNPTFIQNFVTSSVATVTDLHLTNASGLILVEDNFFVRAIGDTTAQGIVLVNGGSIQSTLQISQNAFVGHGATQMQMTFQNSAHTSISMSENELIAPNTSAGSSGIVLSFQDQTITSLALSNNMLMDHGLNQLMITSSIASVLNSNVSDNLFSTENSAATTAGIIVAAQDSAVSNLSIVKNSINFHKTQQIGFTNSSQSVSSIEIANNTLVASHATPGTSGLSLTASGSATTSLAVVANAFVDHESPQLSLNLSGTTQSNVAVSQNNFVAPIGVANTQAMTVLGSNSSICNLAMSQNAMIGHSGQQASMTYSNAAVANMAIASSNFTSLLSTAGTTGISLQAQDSSNVTFNISGSSFFNQDTSGILMTTANTALLTTNLTKNSFVPMQPSVGGSSSGFSIQQGSTGELIANASNNTTGASDGFSFVVSNQSTGQMIATFMDNIVNGGGQVDASTGGIGLLLTSSGTMRASVLNNGLIVNQSLGGVAASIAGTGTICLDLSGNYASVPSAPATFGYTLNGGTGTLNVNNPSYQTDNFGTFNITSVTTGACPF